MTGWTYDQEVSTFKAASKMAQEAVQMQAVTHR